MYDIVLNYIFAVINYCYIIKNNYKAFKSAITTEPKLILKTTSEDYVDYEQLFKF